MRLFQLAGRRQGKRIFASITALVMGLGIASAALSLPAAAAEKVVIVNVTAPLVSRNASNPYAGISSFNVPQGTTSLQYGYNCPSSSDVATSGAFAMNPTGQTSQFSLSYNGPRLDIPSYNNWAFHFDWPAGAPAGITILFDAVCKK